MQRYVKNLAEYLTEALNKVEWLNYKNDTALNTPNPESDVSTVAAFIMKLLNVDDPAAVMFTGDDISISQDYKYFADGVVPKSEQMEEGTIPDAEYTAYYALYKVNDKFFVKMDIKDSYEYSYIFIKEEDYDFFNTMDAPTVPEPAEKPEEPEEPETPAQAAPAQPGGTGATLV